MFRSLLVPLDGSSFGERALPLAIAIARRAEAVLHLVHVHDMAPPTFIDGVPFLDASDSVRRDQENSYLKETAGKITQKHPLRVRTEVLEGGITHALIEYAARIDIDLVILSTHGRGPVGRFWLGGVADRVFLDLVRPVVLVHGENDIPFDHEFEPTLRSILVPLDGSVLAERILSIAMQLADLFAIPLTLVRVVSTEVQPNVTHEGSPAILIQPDLEQLRILQEQRKKEAQAYLDQVAMQVASRGYSVNTHVALDDQAAMGILLEANAGNIDLIAMESHGRRGLSRLFLGSVADKVLQGTRVPLLLHHGEVASTWITRSEKEVVE